MSRFWLAVAVSLAVGLWAWWQAERRERARWRRARARCVVCRHGGAELEVLGNRMHQGCYDAVQGGRWTTGPAGQRVRVER